ncbi:MAG: hypothetical protein ACFNXV_08115, partial [Pauljensenia sp.]
MIHLTPFVITVVLLALVAVSVVVAIAVSRARRLDRLHQRILASRDALSRLLVRRASEVELLAHTASLDPALGGTLLEAARA